MQGTFDQLKSTLTITNINPFLAYDELEPNQEKEKEKAITSINRIDRQTVRMGAPFQKRIQTAAVAAGDCYRDRLDDYHISSCHLSCPCPLLAVLLPLILIADNC